MTDALPCCWEQPSIWHPVATLKGTAYLIFQPAEEIGGGKQVVADGLFDRFPMQRIFGMHNNPAIPLGEFHWRNGHIMAAANFFEIKITGLGAHARNRNSASIPSWPAALW
jgi:hippurate hydrolase